MGLFFLEELQREKTRERFFRELQRGFWREKRKKRNQEDRDLRRLLVRELRRGKLANLVDIGGGLEAFTAEQSFTGKGFSQV